MEFVVMRIIFEESLCNNLDILSILNNIKKILKIAFYNLENYEKCIAVGITISIHICMYVDAYMPVDMHV